MKRIILFALCLLLCFPVPAAAEEAGLYENAGALYEAWVSGGCVPDYITAVISTDGGTDNLTFGLVEGEAGEAGRQEILDLVRDDSSVTILYQTYSRNELYRIQDEIVDAYFGRDLGLVSAGVSEGANKLILEVKTEYAENADTLAMMEAVKKQYGDAVSFEFTDSEIQVVLGIQSATANPVAVMADPRNPFSFFSLALILCCMMLAVLACMEIRRLRPAAAANGAAAVLENQPLSQKEVEQAIRTAEQTPSDALRERVMHSIRDTE